MADGILGIPLEILHRILVLCRPKDIAAFSKSCRTAHASIYHPNEQQLWRSLYLGYPLDDSCTIEKERSTYRLPLVHDTGSEGWREQLFRVIKAETLATSSISVSSEKALSALRTFETALSTLRVARKQGEDDVTVSYTGEWLERSLSASRILDGPDLDEEDESQDISANLAIIRSKVRVCLGSYFDTAFRSKLRKGPLVERRMKSRCYVYDLRNYTPATRRDPFLPGGGIDWVHVDHLMTVVWMNLCEIPKNNIPVPPRGIEAVRAYSVPGSSRNTEDWAGVSGSWSRYVCFMDYRDLFAFNYSDDEYVRETLLFADPSFREAVRLLEVTLKLIPLKDYRSFGYAAPEMPEHDEVDKNHPILFFTGGSRGPSGMESTIRGLVFMDTEGNVKWRLASVYDGAPQWSSSGVQIGGPGSAIGVIGAWSTVLHEIGDPVGMGVWARSGRLTTLTFRLRYLTGPFWMWRNDTQEDLEGMDFL